jgi:hypothetical protein
MRSDDCKNNIVILIRVTDIKKKVTADIGMGFSFRMNNIGAKISRLRSFFANAFSPSSLNGRIKPITVQVLASSTHHHCWLCNQQELHEP